MHLQPSVAALAVSGTKSLLVADFIEKLTVVSEVNQVTIMRVPGHSEFSRMRLQTGYRVRELGPDL